MKRGAILLAGVALAMGLLGGQWAHAATLLPATRGAGHAVPSATLASGARQLASGGGDNILSAVELAPPPQQEASGAVDGLSHPDDVYWFYLEKGATIHFGLAVDSPSPHIALCLYDPNATDILADDPILVDDSYRFPYSDAYTATQNGFYSVDVHSQGGSAAYTLDYSVAHPDDTIPGIPIVASPIVSEVNRDWNRDDVYRLALRAGDTLSMVLVPAPGSYTSVGFDVDLFLHGPGSTSLVPYDQSTNPGIVAQSAHDAPATETITFTAPHPGTYYADVDDFGGFGYYSLSWSVNPVRPSIVRTPGAASLTFKRKKGVARFTLKARFADQFGLPLVGKRVALQTSSDGKRWKSTYPGTTNAGGTCARTFAARKRTRLYFRWTVACGTGARTAAQKVTVK